MQLIKVVLRWPADPNDQYIFEQLRCHFLFSISFHKSNLSLAQTLLSWKFFMFEWEYQFKNSLSFHEKTWLQFFCVKSFFKITFSVLQDPIPLKMDIDQGKILAWRRFWKRPIILDTKHLAPTKRLPISSWRVYHWNHAQFWLHLSVVYIYLVLLFQPYFL